MPGEAGDDADTCTTSLHCARPSAASSGGVDVHGLVGAVCTHGVPVRGSFIDLRTHEAFSYYIIMFATLTPLLHTVRDIYVDFGCRLQSTWARYYALHKGTEELSAAKYPHLEAVRILVNWMHAAGHVLACQLVHSGRFSEGAARRIGEMTEQLWSLVKVRVRAFDCCCRRTRSMLW